HGPSFWLRVGGPLCTTDVDLCFSIEGPPHKQLGRCLMLDSRYVRDNKCRCGFNYSEHWKKSLINPPANTKYVLSESHHELFLTLKYISHLAAEISHQTYPNSPDIFSSYDVNVLLLQHQQTCLAVNVGECFVDIVRIITEKPDDMNKLDITYSSAYSSINCYNDVFFPKREEYARRYQSIAAIAWFMLQVSHSEDSTWIHKLLSLTKEAHSYTWWDTQFSKIDSDRRELRDLRKVIREVDRWFDGSSWSRSPLTMEWNHTDGRLKASLTMKSLS
ncbi:unnamed protein product, partial [Owenia fusiformis]